MLNSNLNEAPIQIKMINQLSKKYYEISKFIHTGALLSVVLSWWLRECVSEPQFLHTLPLARSYEVAGTVERRSPSGTVEGRSPERGRVGTPRTRGSGRGRGDSRAEVNWSCEMAAEVDAGAAEVDPGAAEVDVVVVCVVKPSSFITPDLLSCL